MLFHIVPWLALILGPALLPAQGFDRPAPVSQERESDTDLPFRVIATFPVLKDLVEQIGQDRVRVTSLISGLESEHTYTPKPADIISIRKARILLQIGLGLEVWVEALIRNADNRRLLVITTSQGIPLPEMAESRDGHGVSGDPHIWLDPENVKSMVRRITEGLASVDPGNRDFYLRNQTDYLARLDDSRRRLRLRLEPIQDRGIITHHAAWTYFARWLNLDIRGNIITQVGAEPSAKHIVELINLIRSDNVHVILSEPQLNPKLPRILAEETGARVVVLTPIPGAIPGAETYLSMIEYNVNQLVDAMTD